MRVQGRGELKWWSEREGENEEGKEVRARSLHTRIYIKYIGVDQLMIKKLHRSSSARDQLRERVRERKGET